MNTERLEAIERLIRTPDPFDCWRRHTVTREGDPKRFETYRDYPQRYIAHTRVERDGDTV